jgi:hypothetical protein
LVPQFTQPAQTFSPADRRLTVVVRVRGWPSTVHLVAELPSDDRSNLTRLWVEFDVQAWLGLRGEAFGWAGDRAILEGCGVSGYDEEDCLRLLSVEVFGGRALPPVRRSVHDVDVSALPDRIRAQIGVPIYRGVWFPALNRRPPD